MGGKMAAIIFIYLFERILSSEAALSSTELPRQVEAERDKDSERDAASYFQ